MLVRSEIPIIGHNLATEVAFKNVIPFTACITKIEGATLDDAKELDLAILMYDLIEYTSNYSDTTSSLWFYSKVKVAIVNKNKFS